LEGPATALALEPEAEGDGLDLVWGRARPDMVIGLGG
jgi:hypothetical protein